MKSTRILVAAVLVLSVTAAGQASYIASRPEPVSVLHYPVQRVLSTANGRPGVGLGADLRVRGTKCNDGPDPVPVTGVTSWVSVDPPGTVIETGRGNATRARGCVTRVYTNPIPDPVAARTRVLMAVSGAPCVTWTVTGREQPTNPLIRAETWTTEPFDVCP